MSRAGVSTTATTDQRDQAIVEGLAPGSYTVRIESPGFEPFSQSDVIVRPNARRSREIVLQIAGLVEQLDVAPADVRVRRAPDRARHAILVLAGSA